MNVLREILMELLQDCSTKESFCFSIRCPQCRRVWKSTPIRFSKAGLQPPSEGKKVVYGALYHQERERARIAAAREASGYFNHCPICGQTVCNRCFLICEDLDLCISCAERLQESGSPVATEGSEAI